MLNKNFKKDWRYYNGSISLIECKHFELAIDKDWFGISISISPRLAMFVIQIGHIKLSFY